MSVPNPVDIAWCAGVFEGYGSMGILHTGPPENIKSRITLYLKGEEDVIKRFTAIMGGLIHARESGWGNGKVWWSSESEQHAHKVLRLFWPYLSNAKAQRATQAGLKM